MKGEKLQITEERFLLSAMQHGDLKAYGVLFRRYYPILCAYATKFVELKDAEEIVQDVMLWLWENRETQTFETSLSQYLFKTVYHRAINQIVRHQSQLRADTPFLRKYAGDATGHRFLPTRRATKKDQGSGRRFASRLSGSFCHAPLR